MQWNSKSSKQTTRDAGQQWENVAAQYLSKKGLSCITQNYHCRLGEIDLIMKEGQQRLIFVEVKYRKSNNFGGAISAITPAKQQKLTKTAQFFLQQHGLNEYNTDCRFDVIAIDGDPSSPNISWLKNAF